MAGRGYGVLGTVINTGRSVHVICLLKSRPSGVYGYKAFQDSTRNDFQLRKDSFVSILGITDQALDGNKVIP